MNDEELDENEERDIDEEIDNFKRNYIIRHCFITLLLVIVVATFASEVTQIETLKNFEYIHKDEASEEGSANIDVIAANLKNFRAVIDQNYLGEIDEQKMLDETIKGYVNGLDDEYTEYLTAEEWQEFWEDAFGNFIGIGVVMSIDTNHNIVVIGVVKGSPASEVGIQEGDIIAEADGTNLLGEDAEIASSIIKGHEGEKVHLKIIRENEIVEMDVERREVELYKIETKMLEGNIGYILYQTFDEGSAEDFRIAYEELKAQGAKKIILDLRNNTGGVVEEAEKMADLFLDKGKATITLEDKDKKRITTYTKQDMVITEPTVVLVNGYTASASEMLSGTLQDYDRAEIVGTKTYGKGVMQTVIPLKDGSALKLTTAEYYTSDKFTKINKTGVTPDYEIEFEKDDTDPEKDVQLDKAIEILKSK